MNTDNDPPVDGFDASSDAHRLNLVADLKTLYTRLLPPQHDRVIEDALQHRLVGNTPVDGSARQRLQSFWLRRRIALPVALLTAFMVIATAYASGSLVEQALLFTPGTKQIAERGSATTVNMTRGTCGFSMTIQRVYADPHQIVIGYTISAPANRTLFPGLGDADIRTPPTLTDAQGVTLPMLSMAGPGGSALVGNVAGRYMTYDDSAVIDREGTLALRLTVPKIQIYEQLSATTPASVPCEQYSHVRENGNQTRMVSVSGPFTFDFTVRVPAAIRIADVHQVGTASGLTVTLNRVEVTPSDTRVYLQASGMGVQYCGLRPEIIGAANGSDPGAFRHSVTEPTQGFSTGTCLGNMAKLRPGMGQPYTFNTSLYDYHGPWTLVVYTRETQSSSGGLEVGEPVAFHFSIP